MDFTSITCIVVQIAYFFVWLPYWGDIFFQLGKNILALRFFIFPNWEKNTTTGGLLEGVWLVLSL